MERANENKSEYTSDPEELERMFPGVDFDKYRELVEGYEGGAAGLNGVERVPLFENKIDLLGRTDEFVRWVKEREERVIVGELLLSLLVCEMRVIQVHYSYNNSLLYLVKLKPLFSLVLIYIHTSKSQVMPPGFIPCEIFR